MTACELKEQLDLLANHKDTEISFRHRAWAYLLFGALVLIARTQIELLERNDKRDDK